MTRFCDWILEHPWLTVVMGVVSTFAIVIGCVYLK